MRQLNQIGRVISMLLAVALFFSLIPLSRAFATQNPHLTGFLLTSALGTQTLKEYAEIVNQGEPIKSPNRAFLSSLVVPGSGQLYIGAKRGYLQIAAEVGLLTFYLITHNRANGLRDDYRQEVREHVRFDGPGTFDTWDEIEDFEHATLFDNWHNVYTDNNGQPLERVGKWYWDDRAAFKNETLGANPDAPSQQRLVALQLRNDANDKFERARTFLGLVILNHVVSAIDARIATKSYNRKNFPQAISSRPLELKMQTTLLSHSVESQILLRKRF